MRFPWKRRAWGDRDRMVIDWGLGRERRQVIRI